VPREDPPCYRRKEESVKSMAREENRARAVVEIYLEPGLIPTPGLHPFDTVPRFGQRALGNGSILPGLAEHLVEAVGTGDDSLSPKTGTRSSSPPDFPSPKCSRNAGSTCAPKLGPWLALSLRQRPRMPLDSPQPRTSRNTTRESLPCSDSARARACASGTQRSRGAWRCSHTTNPSEKRLTWTSRPTSSSPSLTHDSSARA